VMRPIETRILGLFCGEKAALSFRHGEKSGFGVFGRPIQATNTSLIVEKLLINTNSAIFALFVRTCRGRTGYLDKCA
jgi:hypothetical protein